MKQILVLALCLVCYTLVAQNYKEVKRFNARYATQAVAVDKHHFYAIDNNHITKFNLQGDSITTWHEPNKERIRHFNSGIVIGSKLYCAQSNFPEVPMSSSIEIFDTKTMKIVETISFGIDIGSCTWILPGKDCWYVFFAHYDKSGANAGGEVLHDVSWSQLVQYDLNWVRKQAWILPKALIEELRPNSCSGAVIVGDSFYLTGHDARQCYVVKFPPYGTHLEWVDTIDVPFPGQGIALDSEGNLWGINRKAKCVIKAQKQ